MIATQSRLFVGSYAPANQQGLHAFDFDRTAGALAARGGVDGVTNPSFLVSHPNGRWLYAVSETTEQGDGIPGSVWAFRITDGTPPLRLLNQQPAGGDAPCHLALDRTGNWLLVSNYATGSVGLLPILPDGSLGPPADRVEHEGHGTNPERQEAPHVHSTLLAPDNAFVIVADLGIDQLVVYRFDARAGKLLSHTAVDAQPGAGPRHTTFHPSGQWLYAANELDNSVTVYAYDGANGTLEAIQRLDTLPPGAPESTVADIHFSASAQRLYVSNRGDNSLAVFEVAADGRLTRLAVRPCGGDWPRNFTITPDETAVLVANQHSDELALLPVQAGTAELGEPTARIGAPQPACVHFVV